MIPLKMNDLMLKLTKYDFYEWEEHDEEISCVLKIGMPNSLLQKLNVPNFYETWGFESVNNENSIPSFTPKQWIEMEKLFFSWLKEISDYIFSKEVLVTPSLEKNWLLYEDLYPDWDKDNKWLAYDYEHYIDKLLESQVICEGPTLREYFRGLMVEDYSELELVGKMAVRGVRLVFFSNDNYVIYITEYLSLVIHFRDEDLLKSFETEMKNNSLKFQLLE